MRLPPTNSRALKIIEVLLQGKCVTPTEGIAFHGELCKTVTELADLYTELVVRGCAERVGPRFKASIALLIHHGLVVEEQLEATRPIVPAPTRPEFRPLSRKYIASSRGLREGSNDLRDLPSHYGKATRSPA